MRVRALVLGVLLAPGAAWCAQDLSRLPELVQAGRMEAAYALASDHVDEQAGTPKFDLYYGIAAVETGHVAKGIFALERVLFARPGLDRARVELARAYFLQKEDRKAREQFQIVLSHDPPSAVVNRVERFLAAIERRADRYETTVTGHVQVGGGWDDNVNRVSEQTTTIEFLGLPFEVGAGTEPESDAFATAQGEVNVSWPIRPGLNVIGGMRGDIRGHQDQTQFDRKRGNAHVGMRFRTGAHRWVATINGRRLVVGSEAFLAAGGLRGSYRYNVDDRTGIHASLTATQLRYDEQEERDASRWLVGGGMSKSWAGWLSPAGRITLQLGQEYAQEDTKAARSRAERDIGRIRGTFRIVPFADWTLGTTASVSASRYDSAGPIVPPEPREEETYTVELDLSWQPTARWQLGPYVTYSQRNSNVKIYEYDRTAGGFRLRYSFY